MKINKGVTLITNKMLLLFAKRPNLNRFFRHVLRRVPRHLPMDLFLEKEMKFLIHQKIILWKKTSFSDSMIIVKSKCFYFIFYNSFIEMAAMPFTSNGILVVVGNLPRIFPMYSLIYASFLIP